MQAVSQKSAQKHAPARHTAWVIGIILISCFGFLAFFSGWWYVYTYGRIGFDSVMFTLTGNLNGVNVEHLIGYLLGGALPAVACTAAVGAALYFLRKKPRSHKFLMPTAIVLSLCLTVQAAFNVELVSFVLAAVQTSTLYEDYYTDPRDVSISFPEEKRNLIYIVLESMETSYLASAQGGGLEENLIPELYALAQNNVNFSHNSDVGGYRDVPGTSWTMGALLAHAGGIPLKNGSGSSESTESEAVFLPGVYTLSNILQEAGYRQAMMVGFLPPNSAAESPSTSATG